jgi:cytochrome c-type biogenesis protein
MEEFSLTLSLAAFFGGVFMFLAPCTLPLVPAFLASLVPPEQKQSAQYRRILMFKTVLFSTGFTIIFVLLGFLTGFFGSKLVPYKIVLSQVGGVFIMLFGLSLLGVFTIPFTQRSFAKIQKVLHASRGRFAPVALGAIFALGWSPCAGPILASILVLASQSGTALQGGILLGIFSLGLMIPFVLVGVLFAHSTFVFRFYERYHTYVSRLSGLFLVCVGAFLVVGNYAFVTQWGFALYSFLGYVPMCTY